MYEICTKLRENIELKLFKRREVCRSPRGKSLEKITYTLSEKSRNQGKIKKKRKKPARNQKKSRTDFFE